MLIRCTMKLLKALGAEPRADNPTEPVLGVFEEWYGNLIWIERRKNLLFTDARTLFSFLIPDVKKHDWNDFLKLFRSNLTLALERQQLDPAPFVARMDSVSFGRTQDRRILSSQNDLVFGYRAHVHGQGGLRRADIHEINFRINETPLKAIRYDSPSDRLRQMAGGCHITTH